MTSFSDTTRALVALLEQVRAEESTARVEWQQACEDYNQLTGHSDLEQTDEYREIMRDRLQKKLGKWALFKFASRRLRALRSVCALFEETPCP